MAETILTIYIFPVVIWGAGGGIRGRSFKARFNCIAVGVCKVCNWGFDSKFYFDPRDLV